MGEWVLMRKKIVEEMIREVYGPREGVEEKLYSDPWKEYVSGVIIPYRWTHKEISDPDSEMLNPEEAGNAEDESSNSEIVPNIPSQLDPKMRPKSFGISFVVNQENPSMDVCVTYGRYFEDKNDDNKFFWKREPNFNISKICDEEKIILHDEDDGQNLSQHTQSSLDEWKSPCDVESG